MTDILLIRVKAKIYSDSSELLRSSLKIEYDIPSEVDSSEKEKRSSFLVPLMRLSSSEFNGEFEVPSDIYFTYTSSVGAVQGTAWKVELSNAKNEKTFETWTYKVNESNSDSFSRTVVAS